MLRKCYAHVQQDTAWAAQLPLHQLPELPLSAITVSCQARTSRLSALQRPAQPAMANHLQRQLHQQQQPRVGRPPGSGAAMAASQVMARAQLHRGPGRPPSRPYAAQTTTGGSQAAIHAAVVQQQHINRQMTRGPNQRVDKVRHCSHHTGPWARWGAINALPGSMRRCWGCAVVVPGGGACGWHRARAAAHTACCQKARLYAKDTRLAMLTRSATPQLPHPESVPLLAAAACLLGPMGLMTPAWALQPQATRFCWRSAALVC